MMGSKAIHASKMDHKNLQLDTALKFVPKNPSNIDNSIGPDNALAQARRRQVVVVVSFISNRIQNGTIPIKIKHFVDIRKHIETLLHLSVVTREATGLIKLAKKLASHYLNQLWPSLLTQICVRRPQSVNSNDISGNIGQNFIFVSYVVL